MASDTVPAAVPGPNEPHGNTADSATNLPQPGGLAGLLAPVQPARSAAFSLDPTPDTAPGDWAGEGVSSASYTPNGAPQTGPDSTTSSSGNRAQTGVVRAWLLAGAERWKQGGVARNKRYDYLKARAAASQVKTTRTETVNNAGGFLGNTRNTGGGKPTGGGSGMNSGGSGKGVKNEKKTPQSPTRTNGGNRNGSTGSSGSSGGSGTGARGGRGGTGNRDTQTRTPHPRKPHTGHDTPKTSKDQAAKDRTAKTDRTHTPHTKADSGRGSGGASGGGPKASSGGRGLTGKDGSKGPSGTGTGKDKNTNSPKTDIFRKNDRTHSAGGAGSGSQNPKPDTTAAAPKNLKKTPKPDIQTTKATDATPKTATATGKDSQASAKATDTTPDANAKKTPASGTRLNLQDSREAGYRDGTRAKKVTAHLEAWRDGARDGWNDTQKAVDREKTRLDTAHADRTKNTSPAQEPKDTPVPKTASSAAYQPHTPPRPNTRPTPAPTPSRTQTDTKAPLDVHSIVGNTITLSGNTARPTISRGEVRTLRRFQQRLEHKADTLTRMAEVTRALEEHAQQQAHRVIQLLEQAKAVKGGDRLIGKLSKLADDATTQACEAAEIHKRALRAADHCRAVHANAEARYGPIYKAIVNACEPESAELAYYRGMGNA